MLHKLLKFEADAFLTSSLLYLLLAGYIAVVYTVILAAVLTGPLAQMKDPFSPPWWINIVVITVVGLTLLPVRRWLQSRLNDLIYGQHDDPYTLITQVNQQLHVMSSPQKTLPEVAETIARTLKLPYVALETTSNTPLLFEYGHKPTQAALTILPLLYLDRPLGELRVATRRANHALSATDIKLLHDIAQYLGIALYVTHLTADLQASRERLVIAREEERRRIRNDLHDGLAPALSSFQLQLGAIRTFMSHNPAQAEAMTQELAEDLRQATAEIRRLVYDLRPPMLDELGLIAAIKHIKLAGSTIQLEVFAPKSMPLLSAAVEVAVYRIASEAIHNVIKHAQANICVVEIQVEPGYLTLTVTNDGQNPPTGYSAGVGIHSMQERAVELGGTFSIQPVENGGTRIVVRLPVES